MDRSKISDSDRSGEPSSTIVENITSSTPVFPGDAAEAIETAGADSKTIRRAKKHSWRILAMLSMLMGFASISTDLYLPAMPVMGKDLNVTPGMIEWTISGYLIGFSLGQLIWGPIGDRYGRKLPVAIGILLFIVGSAACALATTGWMMIFARVLQAAGACAGVVLARAMVRDLYEGDRAAQMMSTLMTIMAIAPLIGPLAGGQVLQFAGWRAIFWLLVGLGTIILICFASMPETLAKHSRIQEPLTAAISRYLILLRNKRVLAFAFSGGFYYCGMFAYLAGTPFAYINYYHVSPQHYGFLFAIGIIGIMVSNTINARLVTKIGSTKLLLLGTAIAAFAGATVAITSYTGWGGLFGLVVPLFGFFIATGFIAANSIAGALRDFPEHAGSVSALVGSIHYGSGVIGSALVGIFADGTPWPMGAVISFAGTSSFFCATLLSRKA